MAARRSAVTSISHSAPYFILAVLCCSHSNRIQAADVGGGKGRVCHNDSRGYGTNRLHCKLTEDSDFVAIARNVTDLALTFAEYHAVHWRRDIFPALGDLKSLHIDVTNVEQLTPGSLRQLTSLESLMVYQNGHDSRDFLLVKNSFEGLMSLKSLNIGRLFFGQLEDGTFYDLSNLTSLNLNENLIGQLPSAVLCDIGKLRTLELYKNDIRNTTDIAFECTPELKTLDLNSNKITWLPARAFGSALQLHQLNLEFNQISHIDPLAFEGLSKLDSLFLGYNKLSIIDSFSLTPLASLRDLELQNNVVTDFITSGTNENKLPVDSLPKLSTVNLNNNKLSVLSESFAILKHARSLSLSFNFIRAIENELEHFSSLTRLLLNDNALYYIGNRSFAHMAELRELGIQNNHLGSLAEGAFWQPVSVELVLRLTGNPWKCDCQLSWVASWLRDVHHAAATAAAVAAKSDSDGDVSNSLQSNDITDVLCVSGSPDNVTVYALDTALFANCSRSHNDAVTLPVTTEPTTLLSSDNSTVANAMNETMSAVHSEAQRTVGIVAGVLSACIVAVTIVVVCVIYNRRRKRYVWEKPTTTCSPPPTPTTRNVSLIYTSPPRGYQWPPASTGTTPTRPLLAIDERS